MDWRLLFDLAGTQTTWANNFGHRPLQPSSYSAKKQPMQISRVIISSVILRRSV
jgi:hypothetical protein